MRKTFLWLLVALVILGVVFGGLLLVRSLSPEDDWLCQNGQWVRHGNPSTPMPNYNCPK